MGACRLPKPVLIARLTRWHPPVASRQSGRSSGVEHNLAKVGVEGSNPFARSSFSRKTNSLRVAAQGRDAAYLRQFTTSSPPNRSEEHTSELQSLMRISYAVFCLKK